MTSLFGEPQSVPQVTCGAFCLITGRASLSKWFASTIAHMTECAQYRCLAQAHIQASGLGALWLELKVLRGLERGYLEISDKIKVAKASLTLRANRYIRCHNAVEIACWPFAAV
jgi:hypothetical protein